jgi:LPS-assembly protein
MSRRSVVSARVFSHRLIRLPRSLVIALVIGLGSGGSPGARAADPTDPPTPELRLPEASALRLETALRESSLEADVPRPTFARGDRMTGRTDRELTYEGNAEIRRGGTSIRADRITHYEADDEVVAVGHVRVARDGQVFTGPQLQIGLDSMRGQFESARFSIALNGGRGRAERVEFLSRSETVLTRAVYTSCLADDPDWYLKTERLAIDQERDEGKATWPTLYVGDVPVFTLPQATFGLTEGRHSGFMSPAFGQSSKVGLEVRVPYYWDIAPNRDLLMSLNYTEKRGFQVGGMARYLEPSASGTTFFEYTAHDQTTGTSRWMLNSMHTTTNWQGWSGGWLLRGVSDDQYFVDYARSVTQSAERSLPRNVFVARGWGDWAVRLNVMQYQNILEARNAPPYDRLPQLTVTGARRDFGGADLTMTLDTNNFRRDLAGTAQGWRMTANPAIAYPIGGPAWYVTPKAMVHASAYRLDENPSGPNDIDRVIPTFSLDAGMVFERPVTLGGRATIQTLEPRLFYVYTPYRDQSNIPVFDSGVANLSFATLFTENNFVGNDRISDANQLTTGAVSRFIDAETGAESLRLALAQRQYFSEQRVTLPGVPVRTDSRSDVLMAASGALGAGHWVDLGAQFSLSTGNMPRLGVGWRWWPSAERLFNVALRYQEKDYAQIDTSWRWPITGRWTTLGRINYSVLKEQFDPASGTLKPVSPQLLEGLAGFEYKQDCWALRLVAQRFITASATRTTSISLQFELSGFARVGLDGFENILLRNIPGYRPAELRPTPMSKFHGYE